MKKLVIIIILLISNFSFYGVVNDEGEKVTNIQEIMQSENVIVEDNAAIETQENAVEEKVEEKIEIQPTEVVEKQEIKNEEIKGTPVKKENTTTKKNENTSINTEKKMEEQKNKQEEKQIEKPKDEINQSKQNQDNSAKEQQLETVIPKCTETNHLMETGNTGKWFDTKQQAVAFYEKEIKEWEEKWLKDEIDDDTYYKNCPNGYEYWSCPLCQKWTLNLYY